jgi:hypothetical protein
MPPTLGRPPHAGHRSSLVDRIVLMGSALTHLNPDHGHVRDALKRLHAEERALRAKVLSGEVLNRSERGG